MLTAPPRRRPVLVTILVAGLVLSLAPGMAGTAAAASQSLEKARERRVELERRLGEVTEQLEVVAGRVQEAENLRERIEADVTALEERAATAGSQVSTRAVHLYKRAQMGDFELLLAAGGPVEAMTRSRLLSGLGRQERETVERAAAARTALAQKRAELDALSERLGADRRRLSGLRSELGRAFTDARAREGELASRRNRQRQVSRARQSGTYSCPLGRPFHFRDTWGAPRSGGRRHKGVDMFAPMGAPVYAITHGVIVRHSHSRLGGIGLYLRGQDGNVYYYTHFQRIAPGYGPGRRVEAGELIGYNGDTGNARGGAPHVHFEVHPGGGRAINPYPFAAAACF